MATTTSHDRRPATARPTRADVRRHHGPGRRGRCAHLRRRRRVPEHPPGRLRSGQRRDQRRGADQLRRPPRHHLRARRHLRAERHRPRRVPRWRDAPPDRQRSLGLGVHRPGRRRRHHDAVRGARRLRAGAVGGRVRQPARHRCDQRAVGAAQLRVRRAVPVDRRRPARPLPSRCRGRHHPGGVRATGTDRRRAARPRDHRRSGHRRRRRHAGVRSRRDRLPDLAGLPGHDRAPPRPLRTRPTSPPDHLAVADDLPTTPTATPTFDPPTIAGEQFEQLDQAWNRADGAAFGSRSSPTTPTSSTSAAPTTRVRSPSERVTRRSSTPSTRAAPSPTASTSPGTIGPGCIVAVVASTLDAPSGPLRGSTRSRITAVLTDEGDRWTIAAFQNTLVQE